jgi:hypothetical protein
VLIHEAEELVRRVPDVLACRIRTDETGAIVALFVTAASARSATEIAVDVITVLAAEARLDVDISRLHVTLLGGSEAPGLGVLEELEHEVRPRLIAVHTDTSAEWTRVEVELGLGVETAMGQAQCRGAGTAPELLAAAVLDGLEKLCGERVTLRLLSVERLTHGTHEIVSVIVQEADGRDARVHVGAARSDGDVARAAAYAALASMNRRIGRILAGPSKHYRIA